MAPSDAAHEYESGSEDVAARKALEGSMPPVSGCVLRLGRASSDFAINSENSRSIYVTGSDRGEAESQLYYCFALLYYNLTSTGLILIVS